MGTAAGKPDPRGDERGRLLRHGRRLEAVTLGWNVAGLVVLAVAAVAARSVALAGFGLDSLLEIGASTVVLWELGGAGERRRRRALTLIGAGFAVLCLYITVQSTLVLLTGHRAAASPLGVGWTAATAGVMFGLAAGKARVGAALGNDVLLAEGRVTFVDGLLATAVLGGLVLNAAVGAWWADPAAGLVIAVYGARETAAVLDETQPAWWQRLRTVAGALRDLVRDPRIPRPVRWLLVLGLLPVPGPFDEAVLLLAAALIATFWRPALRDLLRAGSRTAPGPAQDSAAG